MKDQQESISILIKFAIWEVNINIQNGNVNNHGGVIIAYQIRNCIFAGLKTLHSAVQSHNLRWRCRVPGGGSEATLKPIISNISAVTGLTFPWLPADTFLPSLVHSDTMRLFLCPKEIFLDGGELWAAQEISAGMQFVIKSQSRIFYGAACTSPIREAFT